MSKAKQTGWVCPLRLTIPAICAECGKEFERSQKDWGYVIGKELFCTYKCMRAAQKRRDERKRQHDYAE